MFSCIFAYAKGAETQTTEVNLSDPYAALFLLGDDHQARAVLCAWIADRFDQGASASPNSTSPDRCSIAKPSRAVAASFRVDLPSRHMQRNSA